jgi:hypothetical protein
VCVYVCIYIYIIYIYNKWKKMRRELDVDGNIPKSSSTQSNRMLQYSIGILSCSGNGALQSVLLGFWILSIV